MEVSTTEQNNGHLNAVDVKTDKTIENVTFQKLQERLDGRDSGSGRDDNEQTTPYDPLPDTAENKQPSGRSDHMYMKSKDEEKKTN